MQYDFVNELGYQALATRLKRINEAMVLSSRQMYKELGMDIEPNWFLIFKLLIKFEGLPVTEMAKKLHFSHPSVITIVNKMEKRGYLASNIDKIDSRKNIYILTEKALENIPEFEQVWKAWGLSISRLFPEGEEFLKQLELIEIQMSQTDFMTRTFDELQNKTI